MSQIEISGVPEVEEVQTIALHPGDALVFKTPSTLSAASIVDRLHNQLKAFVERMTGGKFETPIVVLDGGASIEILRAQDYRTINERRAEHGLDPLAKAQEIEL
jgi:hypothetical protein